VRAFGAALRRGPARSETRRAADAAPDLVRGLRRKVKKAAKKIGPSSPPEAYHELRIRGKRLRYALGVLSGVYGQPARRMGERLAGMQEVLGRHQDAHVGLARIETSLAASSPAAAFALGVTAERYAREARAMRARFPKAWERTTGRPWRRFAA